MPLKMPLVSIIIIFLNGEEFIEEAIESVIAQTYGEWEILLVDDGSVDGSTEIARRYASKLPGKIFYLEHENHRNLGMSASRNWGIHHAKGEYIAFLDADDVWRPLKLEQQVSIMETHPEAALVSGRTQWWYSWAGQPEDQKRDFLQNFDLPLDQIILPPKLLVLFLKDEWASLCDVLVRHTIVKKVGGYENVFKGMYEDQAFHSKLCFQFPVYLSSKCWYLYRQHPQACTSASHTKGKTKAARIQFLTWLENYLSQQKAHDSDVWAVVQEELRQYRYSLLSFFIRIMQSTKNSFHKFLSAWHCFLPIWIPGRPYPHIGAVNLGHLRRLTPISREFGYDRGQPIDRYYIEKFLKHHAGDIYGRVLEIGDDSYTRQFGGQKVVTRDVLHVKEGNPIATFIGDLTHADQIPSDAFDCFILTQTLHLVYDFHAALKTIHRILKPGGVVLATVPGISQKCSDEWIDYWCWSFTEFSARQLFEEYFYSGNVQTKVYGNVLAATAFLQGLCVEDLKQQELDYSDNHYELLITVRAVKTEAESEKN